MKHKRWTGIGTGAAVGLALCVAAACADDRPGFQAAGSFVTDAGGAEASDCKFQCTIDGRSIVNACTGEIVETCKEDLACGGARCQAPCTAAAADRSSNGCDFYFQMPRFSKRFPQSCFAAFIVNTTSQAADVKLELRGASIDISKALFSTTAEGSVLTQQVGPIEPGASAILFLEDRKSGIPRGPLDNNGYVSCPDFAVPARVDESELGGTVFGSSFHLTSTMPVAVATMYPIGGARSYLSSATMLLPVPTWAEQHIIVNGWEGGGAGGPGVQIVASEEDTEVTILPKRDIQDGPDVKGTPAGVAMTYHLGKGQLLQLVQSEELTGSIVTSTKPTSLFGGHGCANIPANAGACDILGQQLPAFEQWGSEYVAVGYRPRLGNEHEPVPYRIVAARDGTQLDYDPVIPPGAPTTLSAGESALFYSGTGDAFVVRTQDVDHPIFLAAYMSGGDGDFITGNKGFGSIGDPEFVNVVPAGQYLNAYRFFADPTYSETSLVIVRAKSNGQFKDVWLECAGGYLTDFRPIGTRGEYEYRRVDLSRHYAPGEKFGESTCKTGVQYMRSEGPFTATLWGWDAYASYAYPGGMAQRKLVLTALGPIR
jgi:IgGFc binding protein